ncbi:hypothetical protein AB6D11_00135 [Vibrio splendidus]
METSYEYYFLIGGLLVLATDILVLGTMSPALVSMGLSMFITGLGVSIFGLNSMSASIQLLCISTVVLLYPFWLLCKYCMNKKGPETVVTTPYEGDQFILGEDLIQGVPQEMDYLGCSWIVYFNPSLNQEGSEKSKILLKGEAVTIVRSDVGKLWVLPSAR